MMHLNAQVWQFGGFAPGGRVFGRTPKMPMGAVANPHLADFMNPKGAHATETNHFLGIMRRIRQSSLTAYFNGELNLRTIRRLRQLRNGVFLDRSVFFFATNQKTKGGKRWMGPGITIGGFGEIRHSSFPGAICGGRSRGHAFGK